MSEQQVINLIEQLSGINRLNRFLSSKHEGNFLHLIYPGFKLLDYELLIDFCEEQELLFYSCPKGNLFQLSLFNDPEYGEEVGE